VIVYFRHGAAWFFEYFIAVINKCAFCHMIVLLWCNVESILQEGGGFVKHRENI
jgi:hypothetical protein